MCEHSWWQWGPALAAVVMVGCAQSHGGLPGDAGFGDGSAADGGGVEAGPNDGGPTVDAGADAGLAICGGIAGHGCTSNQFCDYPDQSMCGAADQTGVCRPRPQVCSQVIMPVCGCDGVTYGNACMAQQNGTDVLYDGACMPPVHECTSDADCAPGTHCEPCWVNMLCLPVGAVC